jgi:hypothetical protein
MKPMPILFCCLHNSTFGELRHFLTQQGVNTRSSSLSRPVELL